MNTFVIAKMFIFNEKGELLILRRSQTDERRPGQWDFPGGWAEEGEDMMAAAQRETLEEAGISVETCKLVYGFTDIGDHGSGTWLTFLTHVKGPQNVALSYEHDASEWLQPEEALKKFSYEPQKRMLQHVLDNKLFED